MTKESDCCANTPATSLPQRNQSILDQARVWIMTPRGPTVAGIGLVALGLALNWSWLVAVGAAPIILAFAPCAAMCALGLCMHMGGRTNANVQGPHAGADPDVPALAPPADRTAS